MQANRRAVLGALAGLAAAPRAAAAAQRVLGRRALAAAARGGSLVLEEGRRGGVFVWSPGDMSQRVHADPLQGILVPPARDPSGRSGAWVRERAGVVRVDWFGAMGDGRTNDTDAINAAGLFVEFEGGGTLAFSRATYVVGREEYVPGMASPFRAWEVVAIRGCRRKVTIDGGGATLRTAPGLRFGSFDPATGRPREVKLPFSDGRYQATPFQAAIFLDKNTGGVEVRDIEIDGAIAEARIGGQWGDVGWQIPNHGLHLNGNSGTHVVRNVHAHHLGCDGMMLLSVVRSDAEPPVPTLIEDCRFEYNGRQGVSVLGGKGITFRRCKFRYTGRNGRVRSNPGAGLDLEAEIGIIRDVILQDCEFDANSGSGLGADSGDTARVTCHRCKFIGAFNFALYPNKPDMVFRDCVVVGSAAGFFNDPTGRHAPKFYNCRFSDDPALSVAAKVYEWPVELGSSKGTLFSDCDFTYRKIALPNAQFGTFFHNVRMSSPAPGMAQLNGTFSGTNLINGGANIVASKFKGRVVHNGRVLSP
ncbi:MAG TPA: right-handed parallel beta-helix repeat-containing protein [Allosphingosinicella sp.]|jgi:hypothetical protein